VSVVSPLGDVVGEQWLHPSPKLGTLRHVEALAGTVVLLLVVGLPFAFNGQLLAAGIAVAAVVVAGVLTDVLLQRRVAAWGFCERADDLLVRRGVMVRRLSLVPYGRMQFVDVSAGPLERAFGLATLRLHTAAAASDARVPGLPRAEAERLRDQLSTLGGARMAGL
jgi:membrane protein YdbS with pleckstrin-like domain